MSPPPLPAWTTRVGRAAEGVLLVAPGDLGTVTSWLAEAGYAVAEARRPVQGEVARALGLPETAGANLDALTDSLRDLATWWPGHDRVALVVREAGDLVDADLAGWHTLVDVLAQGRRDLHQGLPGDRELLTVAVVDGHGVPVLGTRP